MNNLQIWEILVPATYKGDKIHLSFHQVWDAEVRKIAGGLTILKSVTGNWMSNITTSVVEDMIPVRIACTKEQIEKIADMTATYYYQEAIMYYKITDEVVIKKY